MRESKKQTRKKTTTIKVDSDPGQSALIRVLEGFGAWIMKKFWPLFFIVLAIIGFSIGWYGGIRFPVEDTEPKQTIESVVHWLPELAPWSSVSRIVSPSYVEVINTRTHGAGIECRSASDVVTLVLEGRQLEALTVRMAQQMVNNALAELKAQGRILPALAGQVENATK